MITELTKEQEQKLEEFRKEWLGHGLSTAPANKPVAERALSVFYERVGQTPPPFLWFDSPYACQKFIQENTGETGYVHPNIWGSPDAYWIAYFLFPHEHIKTIYSDEDYELLKLWAELAKSCFWVYPYENACIVSDRPSVIMRDDENRLHAENGPAVGFRDGWGVYSWHGVNIPRNWIEEKDKMVAADIIRWSNVEQRRCGCEIMGWGRILDELGAKVIQQDKDPQIGTLLEANIPDSGKERFLKVQCGTGRTFVLPVDPGCKTALEANAWTYGLRPEDLKPEVRT